MELTGEDKRIRALFDELKREEEHTSPLFAKTWNVAAAEFSRNGVSRLRFQSPASLPRFAIAILVFSLVVAATVLLPKDLRLARQPTPDYAKQEAAARPSATPEEPLRSGAVPPNKKSDKPIAGLLAIRKPPRAKNTALASAPRVQPLNEIKQNGLSAWQSPTANLLHSASDELLRSVPPMNESAEEMKKFLTNDLN